MADHRSFTVVHLTSTCMTLADILIHVQHASKFGPDQRGRISSALRRVAHVLERPLDEIPIQSSWLHEALRSASPDQHGLSTHQWTIARSLLRSALASADVPFLSGRSAARMTAGWARLYTSLSHPWMRNALSRPLRLFSKWDIEPNEVNASSFARLLVALVGEESHIKRPHQVYREAVRAWNMAVASVPNWPHEKMTIPADRRVIYVKAWAEFPASLHKDMVAMRNAATDPTVRVGRRIRRIRQISAESRARALRVFASTLVDDGVPSHELTSIAELVKPDRVERGLRYLYNREGKRAIPAMYRMVSHLCTLAHHWVHVDERQDERLCKIRSSLTPHRRGGMSERNRAALRSFEDPETVKRLLDLPATIRRELASKAGMSKIDAVRLQIALAVELLIVAPIRVGNLGRIHLDNNLHLTRQRGQSACWIVSFDNEEVSNGVAIKMPLPSDSSSLLLYYLRQVRPELTRVPNRWLFPGHGTEHKDISYLGTQIADLTHEIVGVRVTPHHFRLLAGFLYLRENPEAIEVVRRLLGHKQIQTTLSLYECMEQAVAARHYDDHIAARSAEMVTRSATRQDRR